MDSLKNKVTINEVAIMLQNHIDNEAERHDGFDEKLDGIKKSIILNFSFSNCNNYIIWQLIIFTLRILRLLFHG